MMLATDGSRGGAASLFDRRHHHQHHRFGVFNNKNIMNNGETDYFLAGQQQDDISDCDARSDKSNSNNIAAIHTPKSTPSKCSVESAGRSSRRKQLAPRSRLVRQCEQCDFSSSTTNEFKTHMKFEHGHEQVFMCDTCRYHSLSINDFHFHLNSHHHHHHISKNHRTSPQLSILLPQTTTTTIESDGDNDDDDGDDDDDEHQLNIDDSTSNYFKEQQDPYEESSDDEEQNPSTGGTNKKLNLSVTSSHSHQSNRTTSSTLPLLLPPPLPPPPPPPAPPASDRKRPYNVSVDPARYRRVPDPDDASSVKFACSLCGNLYKWRKSLNKHWKEKHNAESPPPLDAPVTIRPSKTSASSAAAIVVVAAAAQIHSSSSSSSSSQSKQLAIPTTNHRSEMLPQTSSSSSNKQTTTPLNLLGTPSTTATVNHHHPAFPFNPYSWLNPAMAWKLAGANRFPPPTPPDFQQMFQQQQPRSTSHKSKPFVLPPPECNPFFGLPPDHSNRNSVITLSPRTTNSPIDTSCNGPLDLTIKSVKAEPLLSSVICRSDLSAIKKHRPSEESNTSSTGEQRDSSHDDRLHRSIDDEEEEDETMNGGDSRESSRSRHSDEQHDSEHASSSSPPSMTNPYGQKIFICSVCDQRFLAVETVNEHFLRHHLDELENEISGKSPPRNTNVAQQNEEWNLSDPINPLKCIQCDFVGRWPTELQKHAASHSTSRPFKCLVCSLTYKWRWDLAKHWDRAHACGVKGANLINPYKKRDRDQARSMMESTPPSSKKKPTNDRLSISSSISSTSTTKSNNNNNNHNQFSLPPTNDLNNKRINLDDSDDDDDDRSPNSLVSDLDDGEPHIKRIKQEEKLLHPIMTLPTQVPPPPPLSTSFVAPPPSMYFPSSFFPHHPIFPSFMNPSLLLQPKFNYSPRPSMPSMNTSFETLELLKQASAFAQRRQPPTAAAAVSPHSSRSSSSSPRPSSPMQHQQQQRLNAVAAMMAAANGNTNHVRAHHHLRPQYQQQPPPPPQQQIQQRKVEKEERNFQCRWCDYRGRWRSELIQHMRCHHARDKPYHCSACPYASSWKWDVQKHVKKQHAHDTAKIVELPDKYLFQTTLKAKHEGTDDRTLAPAPLTDEDYSFFGIDVQQKLTTMKYTRDRTLACQQCPFAANSMAELRRHLIVHSAESPYHCFNCDYKSKWKCDVKKHMRVCNHHGPVLVGRKAMAKVMESLGLVIGNNHDVNKTAATVSNKQTAAAFAAAAAMQMSTFLVQQQQQQQQQINGSHEQKSAEIDDEDEVIEEEEEEGEEHEDDDDDGNHSLVIVDENQQEIPHSKGIEQHQQSSSSSHRSTGMIRTPNSHLRCRQCDYEADDLSDLLVHRKAHAASSMKQYSMLTRTKVNSDIENDDDEQQQSDEDNEKTQFNYELQWLDNNPLIKPFTTVHHTDRTIVYKCIKCDFSIDNNRQIFLNHLDQQHSENSTWPS